MWRLQPWNGLMRWFAGRRHRATLSELGRRVQVTWQGDSFVGLAEGLDDVGNLHLRLDDGRLMTMAPGDVSLR